MDRAGEVNSNSSNRSQIRPHSRIETLESLGPSSSSPTDGNGERCPERLSRPIIQVHPNVIPNDGPNAIVSPHESPVAMRLNTNPPSSQSFPYRFSGSDDLLYQGTFLPGGTQVFLPNHAPLVHQTHHSPHFRSPQQPIVYDPNFYQFHPGMISHINLRTSVPTIMPSQRTIGGNSMLGPQIGWGNQILPENLYFVNEVGYFIGNLPNPSQNVSFLGPIPQFNMHEQEYPMEMLLEGSTSNPFEMEIQGGTNIEQNGQLQLAGGNAQQLPSPGALTDFINPEMRDTLETQDSNVRGFLMLGQLLQQSQIMAGRQNENMEPILTEEVILKNIRHENFKLIGEETPQTKETCCICQEEYADSEELGVLDCTHRYHIDCIKTWLVLNNSCPICKRKGITLNDEEKKDD